MLALCGSSSNHKENNTKGNLGDLDHGKYIRKKWEIKINKENKHSKCDKVHECLGIKIYK